VHQAGHRYKEAMQAIKHAFHLEHGTENVVVSFFKKNTHFQLTHALAQV